MCEVVAECVDVDIPLDMRWNLESSPNWPKLQASHPSNGFAGVCRGAHLQISPTRQLLKPHPGQLTEEHVKANVPEQMRSTVVGLPHSRIPLLPEPAHVPVT